MKLRVIASTDGKPIAEARVYQPQVDPPQEQWTDAEGVCAVVLSAPLPDCVYIQISGPGFVPQCAFWDIQTPSSLPAQFTVSLEPAIRIGGRVQDEDGAPVEGTLVHLHIHQAISQAAANVRSDLFDKIVQTDAQGRWHFDEAPADFAGVHFRLRHPDFVEELHFTKAEAPAEQYHRESVIWKMSRGVRVAGVVVDHLDRPIADAEILPGRDRVCSGSKPSFRTDAAGVFSIPLSPEREVSLTVKAGGHAPGLVSIVVQQAMPGLRIALEPARTLRGRVVDAAGSPVARALVCADTWRRQRSLEWHTSTDTEGRFEWRSAPADEVVYHILKRGYQPARDVRLSATEAEQTVVLGRPLRVRGAVTDGQTSRRIAAFRVTPGSRMPLPNGREYWWHEHGADFSGGVYEWSFEEPPMRGAVHLLRVEAEGYRPAVLPMPASGEHDGVDFQLQPGPAASGLVLAPDGSPASDATVVIVCGNAAQLVGDVLHAGHGNLKVRTSPDGRFTFSPTEPPYAIVAAHEFGFALAVIAQSDDLHRLQLQPWGRLEIITDGDISADEDVPFYLHYSELPASAPGMPWVTIQPVIRRTTDHRIVFEKVPPGRPVLGRYGQANHTALPLVIDGAKTLTLDFERGVRADEGRVPGTAVVKIVDEFGEPVGGASVEIFGFRLRSQPGSHFSSTLSMRGGPPLTTNRHGVITVSYPAGFENHGDVEFISVIVRHPDFCTARSDCPVAGEALPIVLSRGGTVRVSGSLENGGTTGPIYALTELANPREAIDRETWIRESDGSLRNQQIPPGRASLRLVCFPDGDETHFSDVVEFDAEPGKPIDLRLTLRRGRRLAGVLDETVVRPVLRGTVEVSVRAGNTAGNVSWHARAPIQSNGSFVFASLPSGTVELIALCDGYVSKNGSAERPISPRIPQQFREDAEPLLVQMEPTASVRVRVRDRAGRPRSGTHIHFWPNAIWGGRSARIFAAGLSTEELLRSEPQTRQEQMMNLPGADRFHGVTDPDGESMIPSLPSGKLHFGVIDKGYEMECRGKNAIRPGRGEIELTPGEVRTLTVTMNRVER
ncbi:MAG TPA: carboxypeptidase regulatory-like domain-containing protein [Chthoniobacter sp.]|jgi:protocatechuate 3,4-dioxygenase beta subunit